MTMGPVTSKSDEQVPSVEEATSTPPGVPAKAIEGRSLGQIAWTRLGDARHADDVDVAVAFQSAVEARGQIAQLHVIGAL